MTGKRTQIGLASLLAAGAGGVLLIAHAVTARPQRASPPDEGTAGLARLHAFQPAAPLPARRTVTARWEDAQNLGKLLVRAGVGADDRAAILALEPVHQLDATHGKSLSLTFAAPATPSAPAALLSLDVTAAGKPLLAIARTTSGLAPVSTSLPARPAAKPARPSEQLVRVQGLVGDDLAASLARAGIGNALARGYGDLLARHRPGGLPATAIYDIVIDQAAAGGGADRLVYAALIPAHGPDIRLVRFDKDGTPYWRRPGEAAMLPGSTTSSSPQSWQRPVDAGRMSSRFGWRLHPILRFLKIHSGIDYAAPRGTPVRAAQDGVIAAAASSGGYGKLVEIGHGAGLATRYAHLDGFAVAPGDEVRRGDIIGYVGSTGLSTGPHLHFELLQNGRKIDPAAARIAFSGGTGVDITREVSQRYRTLMALAPLRPR